MYLYIVDWYIINKKKVIKYNKYDSHLQLISQPAELKPTEKKYELSLTNDYTESRVLKIGCVCVLSADMSHKHLIMTNYIQATHTRFCLIHKNGNIVYCRNIIQTHICVRIICIQYKYTLTYFVKLYCLRLYYYVCGGMDWWVTTIFNNCFWRSQYFFWAKKN